MGSTDDMGSQPVCTVTSTASNLLRLLWTVVALQLSAGEGRRFVSRRYVLSDPNFKVGSAPRGYPLGVDIISEIGKSARIRSLPRMLKPQHFLYFPHPSGVEIQSKFLEILTPG